jgi:hypothetical protein
VFFCWLLVVIVLGGLVLVTAGVTWWWACPVCDCSGCPSDGRFACYPCSDFIFDFGVDGCEVVWEVVEVTWVVCTCFAVVCASEAH